MADLDIRNDADVDTVPRDEYAMWEVILWVVGILMIPGVPIIMVWFFAPYSGL
ncbi:MAG TPA: hypothetical protein VHG28_05200 [Longimicrobiaceae bacterium]|nr:hypothetical protein [Longimicrobiaceae bacterium]